MVRVQKCYDSKTGRSAYIFKELVESNRSAYAICLYWITCVTGSFGTRMTLNTKSTPYSSLLVVLCRPISRAKTCNTQMLTVCQ